MLAPIDKKLFRDVRRLTLQLLAVSLVVACAVGVMVLAKSAHQSLVFTSETFYDKHRFADIFASLRRAPLHVSNRIGELSGVDGVEARIVESSLIDVDGMPEPATGLAISIPDSNTPDINQLYLRKGRLPQVASKAEVLLLESFANAHHLEPGDTFRAIINGKRRQLVISGIVLSPEFVFTIGPGDMVPDARRFGVLYARETLMASWFDTKGAFNNLLVKLAAGADFDDALADIDSILKPFGGSGAILRKDQLSHSFLNSELTQLKALSSVIPPIFLLVSIFLVHMILSRLVELEREQIGLLKALGYSNTTTALIYIKLILIVCTVGCAIGSLFGTWAGRALTDLYATFYSFPELFYTFEPAVYLLSFAAAVIAGISGTMTAVFKTFRLTPQVAMSPPAPSSFNGVLTKSVTNLFRGGPMFSMTMRHLLHSPWRSLTTIFGASVSVALLVTALFTQDSIEAMIDSVFFKTYKYDALLYFDNKAEVSAARQVGTWPGVLTAEPFRETRAVFINKHKELRSSIVGITRDAEFRRPQGADGYQQDLPDGALLINNYMAMKLGLSVGDRVTIKLSDHDDKEISLPVGALINEYIGLSAYVSLTTLNSLLNESTLVSGVHLALDPQHELDIYEKIKNTPHIPAIALSSASLREFRYTMDQNILVTAGVYTLLAVVITFGVIYNTARIQLSERSRELASMKIFGFTQSEIFQLFIAEIVLFILVAQPVGWLMGALFSWWVTQGFSSDLFRLPFVIEKSTYTTASLISLAAALFSLLTIRQKVGDLDMVKVLKARE